MSPVKPMTCVDKGSNPLRGDVLYLPMMWSDTNLPDSGPSIIVRKTRVIIDERIRSKYDSIEDVAFSGSTSAVYSVWNASRSETISVSLDA